ncbi:MAG: succinate dehydrogenase assembly factor 2 [Pseudomonadota bacterium]|nr:succinate dehydrogenase assembly factor 2 [Pseudomonadota bacterium]
MDLYDALLSENDQELYAWVTGQTPAAPPFEGLISMIADHAKAMS